MRRNARRASTAVFIKDLNYFFPRLYFFFDIIVKKNAVDTNVYDEISRAVALETVGFLSARGKSFDWRLRLMNVRDEGINKGVAPTAIA